MKTLKHYKNMMLHTLGKSKKLFQKLFFKKQKFYFDSNLKL